MFKRLAQGEFGFARERRAKRMSELLSQSFKYGSTQKWRLATKTYIQTFEQVI